MTATQRIRSMLDGSPVKEIGACGWLHTIGADRDTAEVFSSAIIKMTDYSKWDFIKVMPNGVYNQEAHGSDIEYFSGPLSVEDLKAKRVFQFHRYLINSVKDMEAFPVLDVSKNAVYQREVNVVRALAKHYQGTVPVIPTIFTPAHCIPEFCGGIEQARYYMDNHPEAVDAMLRAGSGYHPSPAWPLRGPVRDGHQPALRFPAQAGDRPCTGHTAEAAASGRARRRHE